jgi:uncharacterized protein
MDKTKSGGKSSQGSGNFKDDPERAAEAGRKGGQSSSGTSKSSGSDDGRKSGSAGRK